MTDETPQRPPSPHTPQTPQWPTDEPPSYPTLGYQPTGEYRQPAAYAQPVADEPPQRRPRGGPLLAGVAVVALVVGGAAGGIGGYLVSDDQGSDAAPASSALSAEPPVKNTSTAPKGSVEAVAQKVLPGVVQVQVSTGQGAGEGSGFVLDTDGHIMTNNHVVQGAADGKGQLRVIFADGTRANATVVGRAPSTDVAVIKAEATDSLTPVELGRSDDLKVGQSVVAIGSPFELSGTVTAGIVSALNRPVTASGSSGEDTAMDAVQTDAAINPGNSGGPLVDMNGRVIGINSAIYSPRSSPTDEAGAGNVGIGFAIPIDQARRTADELIKTGKASQTYIGANVRDAPDGGAAIAGVVDGSPSEKAGLKAGDVVTKLDDRPIDDAAELVAAVRTRAAGEKVTLTVAGGRTVDITLGAQPANGGG